MSSNNPSQATATGETDKSNVTFFLAPLAAVIVVGFLGLWLHRRHRDRRQRRKRAMQPSSPTVARATVERDLEAAWVRGASTRRGAPERSTRHPEMTERRTITGRIDLRRGPGNGREPVEGLNELGEAPPPYDPRGRESLAKDEVVETRTTLRAGGPSTDGGSRPSPGTEPTTAVVSAGELSMPPPGYDELGTAEHPTRPPPAFDPSQPPPRNMP